MIAVLPCYTVRILGRRGGLCDWLSTGGGGDARLLDWRTARHTGAWHSTSPLSRTYDTHCLIIYTLYSVCLASISDPLLHFYLCDAMLARCTSYRPVSVCVGHKSEFYRNGWTDRADSFSQGLTVTCATLCSTKIRVSSKIYFPP